MAIGWLTTKTGRGRRLAVQTLHKETDMRIVKRIGWLLAGVAIGVLITTTAHANIQLPEPRQARIVKVASSGVDGRTFTIVRDTKSDGCWLVINTSDGVAVSQAPATACFQ